MLNFATSLILVQSRKSLCWLFISPTFLSLVLQDNLFQSNKISVLLTTETSLCSRTPVMADVGVINMAKDHHMKLVVFTIQDKIYDLVALL